MQIYNTGRRTRGWAAWASSSVLTVKDPHFNLNSKNKKKIPLIKTYTVMQNSGIFTNQDWERAGFK